MGYKTVFKDVIFIEGTDDRVNIKSEVSYSYGSFGAQLKGLNGVKESLAIQAKMRECNCIVEFTYGQKSSLFSLDDTKWFGNGKCGILTSEDYNSILKEINNR